MPANYGIDILNTIRNNASTEYQSRIPTATQTNISTIGQAFSTYTLLYNEFCNALFNQIGRVILEQKMFKNKLSRFKSGMITNAQDVQEIFVEMAKAEGDYKPDGPNPLGRRDPSDVKAIYHRQNRQDYYAISIGDIDFNRVFKSPATLDAFITRQINSVYSGDEYDEWLAMKNVIATYNHYAVYNVPDITPSTVATAPKTFIKTLRRAVNDMSFPSKNFNAAGVLTWTDPKDMVLFVHKDVLVEVDVEQLATAFHTSHTDMKVVPTIITMDDFGSLTNTYALLADKDWLRVYDTLSTMKTQYNAQGLFTNYFYHHHQILSASKFKNAILFSTSGANEPE